jgi:hypothetical protein
MLGSPNPQVRLAIYVVRWFEASMGRRSYSELKGLIGAAFMAADKEPPPWIERLEIEMHRQGQKREKWFKAISS